MVQEGMDRRDSALQLLRMRARSLSLSSQAMERAGEILKAASWKDKDADERLRKEWFNDVLADTDENFQRAASDPDEHFLAWLEARVGDPYAVSIRAQDAVARAHGAGTALFMATVRWRQEIAWAQRMRTHFDPKRAVTAALFLAEARRSPGKAFRALSDLHRANLGANLQRGHHPNDDLQPEEIREGAGVEAGWTPLFLQYGTQAFARLLENLSEARLNQLAVAAAREEQEDLERLRIVSCLDYLKRYPLSCRITALGQAVREGLSSNDLVACEDAFVEALSRGQIPLPENEMTIDREFYRWMKAGNFVPDQPDDEEVERRLTKLSFIDTAWVDALPPDILDLGAGSRTLFARWRAAVLSGRRPPPRSRRVDYALFVFQTSSADNR